MKLGFRDIDHFVKSPPSDIKAVLIYGPDQGLVKERSKLIGKTVVPDLSDPFLVTPLGNDDLIDDPSRLNDEANALSMMGGRRLIIVSNADDKATQACKNTIEDANFDSLVIIEAGELGPKSPLRVLFEKEKNVAALPCYVEDGKALDYTLRNLIESHGKSASRDAIAFLLQNIQGDRMIIQSEIDKLCLYVGDKKVIEYEDCLEIIGARGTTGFAQITFAVASGNIKELSAKLHQAFDEGFPPQALIRGMQNHLKRLYQAKVYVQSGKTPKEAMESIHPKVFFKEQPSFQAQIAKWSLPRIERALGYLLEIDKETKTTNIPAETLCAHAFTKLGSF